MCSDMGNGWGTEAVGIGLVAQQSNGQLIPERLLWEAPNLKNANRAFQRAFNKAHRGYLPGKLFQNNPHLERTCKLFGDLPAFDAAGFGAEVDADERIAEGVAYPPVQKGAPNVSLGRRSPTHPNKNARFCEAACAGNS